jgi:hypothetical protein
VVRRGILHLKSARRLARPRTPRLALGAPDERLVFVVGSPRSGTTFLGSTLGALPGFVDLGEVPAFKADVARLAPLTTQEAARAIRRTLSLTRTIGLVRGLRGVVQTPEAAFLVEPILLAYPHARVIHLVRDGRDVVCSLLERGWLNAGRTGADDAGLGYGPAARFWVEPGRAAEFAAASDARRAAWAWRRYVETACGAVRPEVREFRYERLSAEREAVATELAGFLDVPEAPLVVGLRGARASSIGRFRTDLDSERLAEVEEEAGDLLRDLGYETAATATR